MNGPKTIVGLCMLCALLISAFAAQSASAITGTTVFTCVEGSVAPNQFTDSHCKSAGEGKYRHVSIAENTTTQLTGNSHGEPMKLKTTVGGLGFTLTATGLQGSGSMENKVDPSGEHYVQGELTGVFTEVTTSNPKCFVYKDEGGVKGAQGVIETESLVTTSTNQGMGVKFTPAVGGAFARFWILDKNKKTAAEGGECGGGATYLVSGSVIGTPEGATFVFTHAGTTTQNTLKMGPTEAGAKAGLEGVIAFEGKDPKIEGDTYKPLSVTTVST